MKPSKKERTRQEILQVAKALIREKGPDALTVRLLAEKTGYAHTNLYYYFSDFNTFLWILRLEMIDDMIAALTDASSQPNAVESAEPNPTRATTVSPSTESADPADPLEALVEDFLAYGSYFLDNPNVFRFFYFHASNPPEGLDVNTALNGKFQGIWQRSFSRMVQEGVMKQEALALAAKTIIHAVQGMLLLRLSSFGSVNREDMRNELMSLIRFIFNK